MNKDAMNLAETLSVFIVLQVALAVVRSYNAAQLCMVDVVCEK